MTTKELIDEVLSRPEDYGEIASKLARMLQKAIEQRDSAILAKYEKTIGNRMINRLEITIDRIARGEE